MSKAMYAAFAVILFAIGAYFWKINNTGYKAAIDSGDVAKSPILDRRAVLVEVGGSPITAEELDWEYALHTDGVADRKTLTPIPDLGAKYAQELSTLKKSLLTGMIERKLLFTYIQADKTFDLNDPGRYVGCLQEWQERIKSGSKHFSTPVSRERLKTRLCERSILEQYMADRLFAKLSVSEAEIVEYYRNNLAQFKKPEQVTIMQIVLSNEQDAKRARNQVTSGNFESLARQLSITPEAEQGGRLGPFSKGEMPEFFDVAFKMREGQISGILKSNYGFHIIMLTDRQKAADISLAAATPTIVSALKQRRQNEEYQKWVERALAQVSVSTPKPLW